MVASEEKVRALMDAREALAIAVKCRAFVILRRAALRRCADLP